MGNQARVPDGVNMFSTSTRNLGKLPTPAEYLQVYKEKVEPNAANVYKYLQFDEM